MPRSRAYFATAFLIPAVIAVAGAPAAAQRPDTLRYVALFSGRPAGSYLERRMGDTTFGTFEYNDRGRGPHIETTIVFGPGGSMTAYRAVGHAYLKDTVDERFTAGADSAEWRNSVERGTRAAPGRAMYLPANESPSGYADLVRVALAAGGRVPLLPEGSLDVQRAAERTVQVNGTRVRLTLYQVGGLGFSPVPVWIADGGRQFATVSSWFSVVPAGWESVIPQLIGVQDSARDARYLRLARQLSHRPTGPLVFRHARLFVAESATVSPNTTVIVTGNRITAVGPDASVAVPPGAQVIDATGKTLLPGLWDMHVHIGPGDDGLLHIAAGVTSARDMGNDTTTVLVLRRRFATDSLIGPRLTLAGLIDGSGPYQVPTGVLADDSLSARRAVDWYADHGYEQIKLYSSMKPGLVPGIIAEAHARGLRVSGHVPAFMTAAEVVRLGFNETQHANFLLLNFMDSVKDTRSMARFTAIGEHGGEIDMASPAVRDLIALYKSHGADIDPTLVAFENMFTARPGQVAPSEAEIVDRMPATIRRGFYSGGLPVPPGMDQRYRDGFAAMLRMVRAMYDAGVPVVAGTDDIPGFSLHRELELYVQAGIPAPAVLRIATYGGASIMHHQDERGSVAVGKLADLVLVDGDPTVDIRTIRKTALVVKDGLVFRPSELYRELGIRP